MAGEKDVNFCPLVSSLRHRLAGELAAGRAGELAKLANLANLGGNLERASKNRKNNDPLARLPLASSCHPESSNPAGGHKDLLAKLAKLAKVNLLRRKNKCRNWSKPRAPNGNALTEV